MPTGSLAAALNRHGVDAVLVRDRILGKVPPSTEPDIDPLPDADAGRPRST